MLSLHGNINVKHKRKDVFITNSPKFKTIYNANLKML